MISTILENSLVNYSFERINDWRGAPDVIISTDNQIFRDIQIISKKVAIGLSFAVVAVASIVESLVRFIFAQFVNLYGYLAESDVTALALQIEEGIVDTVRGAGHSSFAFVEHIRGDAGIRIDVSPMREVEDTAVNGVRAILRA